MKQTNVHKTKRLSFIQFLGLALLLLATEQSLGARLHVRTQTFSRFHLSPVSLSLHARLGERLLHGRRNLTLRLASVSRVFGEESSLRLLPHFLTIHRDANKNGILPQPLGHNVGIGGRDLPHGLVGSVALLFAGGKLAAKRQKHERHEPPLTPHLSCDRTRSVCLALLLASAGREKEKGQECAWQCMPLTHRSVCPSGTERSRPHFLF